MTNGDYIRSLHDDELADWIAETDACDVCVFYETNQCGFSDCRRGILTGLKQVKENNDENSRTQC